jgi:hypothetical protein
MNTQILVPATVLILWSMIMLGWMAFTRLPAMKKKGIDMGARAGGRGQDLEGVLDPRINWKAHNYAHLMEQPTLFYAVVMILALLGAGGSLSLALAWAYVGLRIVHSVWQASVNTVPIRFAIFALSSLCLMGLAIVALLAAF